MIFKVYFESDEVNACIVTCGGLCPGLNTVIREIVCGLYDMYGVRRILGIEVCNYVLGIVLTELLVTGTVPHPQYSVVPGLQPHFQLLFRGGFINRLSS